MYAQIVEASMYLHAMVAIPATPKHPAAAAAAAADDAAATPKRPYPNFAASMDKDSNRGLKEMVETAEVQRIWAHPAHMVEIHCFDTHGRKRH
jgi:hypothetical protein